MSTRDKEFRIIVIGPTGSGKSTLAQKLAYTLEVPIFHLDQLRFLPNTNWQPRAFKDFKKLHDEIVASQSWIIEGNYRELLPYRLSRATTVIWLNPPIWRCIFNFYRRFFRKNRNINIYPGRLQGAKEHFSLRPFKYILRHKIHKKIYSTLITDNFQGKLVILTKFSDICSFK